VPIRVGGIYKTNALVTGYLVSLATMQPNVPTARDDLVLANAAPGVPQPAAEAALRKDMSAFPLLLAKSRDEYRTFVGASLDTFLNLITTLLAFAIIIAVLGIANTLALSVLERTRELGLLRALGMTRSQTRTMVRWESVIISLLGAVLGLVVGTSLGVVVTSALHNLGIDSISIPGGNLVFYAVAAGVFGVVAAIVPTIRAARVDILRAITTE
jgi:putative ABC transport system permease protein